MNQHRRCCHRQLSTPAASAPPAPPAPPVLPAITGTTKISCTGVSYLRRVITCFPPFPPLPPLEPPPSEHYRFQSLSCATIGTTHLRGATCTVSWSLSLCYHHWNHHSQSRYTVSGLPYQYTSPLETPPEASPTCASLGAYHLQDRRDSLQSSSELAITYRSHCRYPYRCLYRESQCVRCITILSSESPGKSISSISSGLMSPSMSESGVLSHRLVSVSVYRTRCLYRCRVSGIGICPLYRSCVCVSVSVSIIVSVSVSVSCIGVLYRYLYQYPYRYQYVVSVSQYQFCVCIVYPVSKPSVSVSVSISMPSYR